MKCCFCKKEIPYGGILISCDGDFVCNEVCKKAFYDEMDKVCNMTDSEFYTWMGVDNV